MRRRADAGNGRALAVVGGVLGLLSLLAGGLFYSVLLQSHVFEGHLTTYTALSSGDCFDPPVGLVKFFHQVPCSGDHEGEVTGSFQDSAGANTPYPGESLLTPTVVAGCQRQTTGYVGAPLDPSRYRLHYYGPSRLQWENGERTIVCTVGSADRTKLRGSVRGV